MAQKINDLVDLKILLAEPYEQWVRDWNDDPDDYNIDYDKESELLDSMISVLCTHITEIQNLPEEDYSQN